MTDWKQFQCAIVVENQYNLQVAKGWRVNRHQKGVHGVRGSKRDIREIGALDTVLGSFEKRKVRQKDRVGHDTKRGYDLI